MRKSVWLLAVLIFTGCTEDKAVQSEPVVRPAKIVQVQASGEQLFRNFPGTVEAATKSNLAFRVGGQLNRLPAIPGASFKKGALLAQLDEAQFRNALNDREARYALAKSQYDKVVLLRESNHASPADFDTVQANLKAAKAALTAAQDNLKYTRLLAPFDGVVTHLQTENYQAVKANETIMQLRGDDFLDVRFDIPESLIGKLKKVEDPSGYCGQVRFNTYAQQSYRACFKEYESTPDAHTRSYSVVLSLPKVEEFTALPGMAVMVSLDLSALMASDNRRGVLAPLSAVFEEAGKTWVWKLDEHMRVNKTEVTIANIINEQVLITQGLQPTEAIVAVGVAFLQQGQQVKPLAKERGL